MNRQHIEKLKSGHKILAEHTFEEREIHKGYARRTLRIDLSNNQITELPVSDEMIEKWTGGRGFDMWLMFNEINKDTKWDSPENPLCFSSGPLGGVASFPGSGKTIVTGLSPLTKSVMDCNVGGYFGPYFKFCGFDALTVVGEASEEVVILIDGETNKVTIETAPYEAIDSHVLAEELTELFAVDEDDKRNVAVVSAGRGAQHTYMGVLNFSFYDWRRGVARMKQAGRGGLGSVLRNKSIKALICKNREITPAWRISKPKVPKLPVKAEGCSDCKGDELSRARRIIAEWNADPEYVIEMMQDIQDKERHISKEALTELCRITGVPKGQLFHIATFYKAFSLKPRGEHVVQVCMGTACHVKGAARVLDSFSRELGVASGDTTADEKFTLEAVACLGCCSIAPVVRIDDEIIGDFQPRDVEKTLTRFRKAGNAGN